jgi:hypothetical protein
MADKVLLKKSIDSLEYNNTLILKRLRNVTDKNKIEELNRTIAKNNSMILDYKFQLEMNKLE